MLRKISPISIALWLTLICSGAAVVNYSLNNESVPKQIAAIGGYNIGMGVCGLLGTLFMVTRQD